MSKLLISTIIPTYNHADYICRAVSSVLAESSPDDEVIVVDDGSTDKTAETLRDYGDRIQYFRIPNSGVSAARNFGIKKAKHDLIAFLDSDDEWMRGKLDMQRSLMEARPDILFCCSDFAVKDRDDTIHHKYLRNWHNDSRGWDKILGPAIPLSDIVPLRGLFENVNVHFGDLYPSMMSGCYVCVQSLVVRRKAAGDALHFPEDLSLCEVWECAANLSRKGLAAYIDCETNCHYDHSGVRLSDWDSLRYATSRRTILKRIWGHDPAYLEKHGDLYRQTLKQQELQRFRSLVVRGQTKTARADLRELDGVPLFYHALARLPGPIAKGLLKLRRSRK